MRKVQQPKIAPRGGASSSVNFKRVLTKIITHVLIIIVKTFRFRKRLTN